MMSNMKVRLSTRDWETAGLLKYFLFALLERFMNTTSSKMSIQRVRKVVQKQLFLCNSA